MDGQAGMRHGFVGVRTAKIGRFCGVGGMSCSLSLKIRVVAVSWGAEGKKGVLIWEMYTTCGVADRIAVERKRLMDACVDGEGREACIHMS